MELKNYRALSSAERSRILSDIVGRLVEPMARNIVMLGGEKNPEVVFSGKSDDKTGYLTYGEELHHFMILIHESLEMSSFPIGFVYESVDGFVREPYIADDEDQIKMLTEYDRKLTEVRYGAESATKTSA